MSLVALGGAVELGLCYALLALGIFVSYRILNVADLTVEGSFTTGAAVCAMWTAGGHPIIGILLAMVAGAGAGLCSAILQTKLRVQPILAGILTMTALYSINLQIMRGKSNVSLLRSGTLFTLLENPLSERKIERWLLPLCVVVVVAVLLGVFLHSQLGLSIRATGDNEEMVRSSSINPNFTKAVGLSVANAVVGLSGGLIAQYQGFADIGMGIGMVVVALASLIIGEALFGRRGVNWNIGAVIVGAVLYRVILAIVLAFRLNPSSQKLISAVIVAVAISYPTVQTLWKVHKLKRKAGKRNAVSQ